MTDTLTIRVTLGPWAASYRQREPEKFREMVRGLIEHQNRCYQLCGTTLFNFEETDNAFELAHIASLAQELHATRAERDEMVRRNALLRTRPDLNLPDDPGADATDAAHPAWWRGEQYGSIAAARVMRDALDGKDDGAGKFSDPALTKLRDDLIAARAFIEEQAGFDCEAASTWTKAPPPNCRCGPCRARAVLAAPSGPAGDGVPPPGKGAAEAV